MLHAVIFYTTFYLKTRWVLIHRGAFDELDDRRDIQLALLLPFFLEFAGLALVIDTWWQRRAGEG